MVIFYVIRAFFLVIWSVILGNSLVSLYSWTFLGAATFSKPACALWALTRLLLQWPHRLHGLRNTLLPKNEVKTHHVVQYGRTCGCSIRAGGDQSSLLD